MESYWFVCFTTYYYDKEQNLSEIKANSVHKLNSEIFLPGTVKRGLEKFFLEDLGKKKEILSDFEPEVIIESFEKIEKEGFNNFTDKESNKTHRFSFAGRTFTRKKVKVEID